MLNKKRLLKTILGITPAVIGVIISFNGLKGIESSAENKIDNSVNIFNASLKEIADNTKSISEEVDEVNTTVSEVAEAVSEEIVPVDIDIDPKEVVVISKAGLNVREDANINSEIIKVYPFAKSITVTKEKEDWYKTEDGYISKNYVMEIEEALETSTISNSDIEMYKRMYEDHRLELNKGVTGISGLSLNDIYVYTNKYPGLRGIEQAAIEAEYKYDINAFITIAVASLESGYGKSDIAMNKNNLYGMNAQDHNPYELAYSYDSKYESVMDFAKRLSTYYTNKGLTTLDSIQRKYCPTNSNWDESVASVMNNLYTLVDSARE